MRVKYIYLLVMSLICLWFPATGQKSNWCGTVEATNKFISTHPELLPQIQKLDQAFENRYKQLISQKKADDSTIYVIPVVFHILHLNGIENISDDQIKDAIRILNEDYRKFNPDTVDVVASFKGIIGNASIEFRLARIDPSNNSSSGIDRIYSTETNVGDAGSMLNQWPRSKYLNIWVVRDIASGAAGWTNKPATVDSWPSDDGIMIQSTYVGSIGTGSYSRSRALVHEVGHWIDLSHTWGNTNNPECDGTQTTPPCSGFNNCNIDDGVFDTPNTIGHTWCDLTAVTCGSLDNVQNYMDYSYCDRMFTKGQVTRMRAALDTTIAQRNNLWTTANLTATGTNNNEVVFTSSKKYICAGEPVSFKDYSYNKVISWNWNINGANPSTSTDKNPTVTFVQPGNQNVTLTTINQNGVQLSKTEVIKVLAPKSLPYTESFDNDPDWEIINPDNGRNWTYTKQASYSTGGGCYIMNNFNGNTKLAVDELLSPPIDLTPLTSVTLKFKLAHAQLTSTTSDKLYFWISNDCGTTWSPRKSWIGATLSTAGVNSGSFVPTAAEWREETITTEIQTTYYTERFRFKFKFESDAGNYLYIDDISITGTYSNIPILRLPANYSSGQPVSLAIDWDPISNSSKYEYLVDTASTFNSALLIMGSNVATDGITDTKADLTSLGSMTTYYWKVRVFLTSGDSSSWSSMWNFTTADPSTINENNNADGFAIYPNPNTGEFHLRTTNVYEYTNIGIRVCNILGEVVFERRTTNNKQQTINLSGHPSGLYFLHVKTDRGIWVKKVIYLNP